MNVVFIFQMHLMGDNVHDLTTTSKMITKCTFEKNCPCLQNKQISYNPSAKIYMTKANNLNF